jgi:hypothetical protein
MSELLTWLRVPPDSTLSVSVEPLDGQFTCTGAVYRYSDSNPPDDKWSDTDVRPGPKELTLEGATDYLVDLLVQFVGSTTSTAIIRASVTKPDGSPFGRARTAELSGRNGNPPDAVTLILITQ